MWELPSIPIATAPSGESARTSIRSVMPARSAGPFGGREVSSISSGCMDALRNGGDRLGQAAASQPQFIGVLVGGVLGFVVAVPVGVVPYGLAGEGMHMFDDHVGAVG